MVCVEGGLLWFRSFDTDNAREERFSVVCGKCRGWRSLERMVGVIRGTQCCHVRQHVDGNRTIICELKGNEEKNRFLF